MDEDESTELAPKRQSLFPISGEDIVDNALQNLDETQAKRVSEKAADDGHHQAQHDGNDQHGDDGDVDACVAALDADVARQTRPNQPSAPVIAGKPVTIASTPNATSSIPSVRPSIGSSYSVAPEQACCHASSSNVPSWISAHRYGAGASACCIWPSGA